MALLNNELLRDFYAMLRMVVDEQSPTERQKLSVELWERAFEIVEMSRSLSTRPARDAQRGQNVIRDKLIAKAKNLYEQHPKHSVASLAKRTLKGRRQRYPGEKSMRNWITEAKIVGNS